MANRFTFKVVNTEESKKRYRPVDIGYALKLSADAITSYFQNKGISTKNGLTLDQIEDAILHGNLGGRGGYVDTGKADEIVRRLREEKNILLNDDAQDEQMTIGE